MYAKICAAALAAFIVVSPIAAGHAATDEKKITPQQQKMKDCGAKWQDYKTAKNVKGNAEYRKFLSGCLKGQPKS